MLLTLWMMLREKKYHSNGLGTPSINIGQHSEKEKESFGD
jgi:hypothetical protein